MSDHVMCPACGSEDVERHAETRVAILPYAPATSFPVANYKCRNCGESGDFAGENDALVEKAEKEAVASSLSSMTEMLAAKGISMAYLERALRLPQRTVARWKSQGASASAAALMRLVVTYPWLLEVADVGFGPATANRKVIEEAARLLSSAMEGYEIRGTLTASPQGNSIDVNANVVIEMPMPKSETARNVVTVCPQPVLAE